MKKIFTAIFILSTLAACKKEAGEGGNSTIKGNVLVKSYTSDFQIVKEEYPAQETDVYIIYGDNQIFGDDTKTDYNGDYEFKYLREGKYYVYAYSKDSANPQSDKKLAIVKEVEITKKKQTVEAPQIIIKD